MMMMRYALPITLHLMGSAWKTSLANVDDGARSCACALADSDHVLDCADATTLRTATAALGIEACQNDCSSASCRANYYVVQAHHDYCWPADLPSSLKTARHNYEDACQHCHVIRQTRSDIPDCFRANCEDTSGNYAHSELLRLNCDDDCSSTDCQTHFRTLRSVYDNCAHDTLSKSAELYLNDVASQACISQDCNTGHSSTDQSQKLCDPNDRATRAPALARPTPAPTPVVCPDLVQTADQTSICSICGVNRCITKPQAVFEWPGQPSLNCTIFQDSGLQGYLPEEYCAQLPGLVQHICECQASDTVVPYTLPPESPAAAGRTPDETKAPSNSTTNSSLSAAAGIGIFAGVLGVVAIVAFGVWRHRQHHHKVTRLAEIELEEQRAKQQDSTTAA